jgi:hypothetical protein
MGSPKPHARSSCPGSPVERSHYGAINTGARAIIGRLAARDLDRIFGSKLSRSATILQRTALCRDLAVRKREEFAAF